MISATLTVLAPSVNAATAISKMELQINGSASEINTSYLNGQLMVPLEEIGKKLNLSVEKDPKTKVFTIYSDKMILLVKPSSSLAHYVEANFKSLGRVVSDSNQTKITSNSFEMSSSTCYESTNINIELNGETLLDETSSTQSQCDHVETFLISKKFVFPASVTSIQDITYVPLSKFAELFGYKFSLDEQKNIIILAGTPIATSGIEQFGTNLYAEVEAFQKTNGIKKQVLSFDFMYQTNDVFMQTLGKLVASLYEPYLYEVKNEKYMNKNVYLINQVGLDIKDSSGKTVTLPTPKLKKFKTRQAMEKAIASGDIYDLKTGIIVNVKDITATNQSSKITFAYKNKLYYVERDYFITLEKLFR